VAPKKTTAKKPVAKKSPAKKVEIIKDVASKPLNVIQPVIEPKIVNEFKGESKCDKSCACKPHWFWRLLAFDWLFNWDWCKEKK